MTAIAGWAFPVQWEIFPAARSGQRCWSGSVVVNAVGLGATENFPDERNSPPVSREPLTNARTHSPIVPGTTRAR